MRSILDMPFRDVLITVFAIYVLFTVLAAAFGKFVSSDLRGAARFVLGFSVLTYVIGGPGTKAFGVIPTEGLWWQIPTIFSLAVPFWDKRGSRP